MEVSLRSPREQGHSWWQAVAVRYLAAAQGCGWMLQTAYCVER